MVPTLLFATVWRCVPVMLFFFFFNDTATTEIYTLSLHDALPISLRETIRHYGAYREKNAPAPGWHRQFDPDRRSEEHTSELQSRLHLVCRLLLEKKKQHNKNKSIDTKKKKKNHH